MAAMQANFDVIQAIRALALSLELRVDEDAGALAAEFDPEARTFKLTCTPSLSGSERLGLTCLYCAARQPLEQGLARATWVRGRLELGVLANSPATASELRKIIEQQAVALLLPEQLLRARFTELLQEHDIKWRGHGDLFVDQQGGNIESAEKVIAQLSASFGYPSAIVRARVIDLGWLKDVRPAKPARVQLDTLMRKLAERASAAQAQQQIKPAQE